MRVWRVDERTITVQFRRRKLGEGVSSYTWFAISRWASESSKACPLLRGECIDQVPDAGGVVTHDL
ncbi:MAG: hypothetical protein M3493_10075 [Actinomycetota bacterium]|nr:hypothetical protein [Actinomycetota bacterium]